MPHFTDLDPQIRQYILHLATKRDNTTDFVAFRRMRLVNHLFNSQMLVLAGIRVEELAIQLAKLVPRLNQLNDDFARNLVSTWQAGGGASREALRNWAYAEEQAGLWKKQGELYMERRRFKVLCNAKWILTSGRRQLASMNAGLNSRLASGGSTATVGGVVKDGWREKDMYEDRSEEEGGDTSKGNRSVRTQCDWRQRIP